MNGHSHNGTAPAGRKKSVCAFGSNGTIGGHSKDDRDWQILNSGDDNQLEAFGYEPCSFRNTITWILILASAGFLRLFFHWYPQFLLTSTHRRCPLKRAKKILVVERYQDKHKTYFVKVVKTIHVSPDSAVPAISSANDDKVQAAVKDVGVLKVKIWLANGEVLEVDSIRVITVKKQTFVWISSGGVSTGYFERLAGMEHTTHNDLHNQRQKGVIGADSYRRRMVYGGNTIHIKVLSYTVLALLEVLNPFYMFQIFSIAVWISEGYYYYTVAIIFMSTFGIISSIRQTRRNQKALNDTVAGADVVSVLRRPGPDGDVSQDVYEEVSTSALVPGDVIVIPSHGCTLQCDAALLSGTCIVNESMLTGESVPVMKTPLPRMAGVQYDIKQDSRHTLFCGTKVIQTRYYEDSKVLAVVLRTGFMTSKGELVRSILYPPPADFLFERDSYKFIGILAVIALAGLIYTSVSKGTRGIQAGDIAQKALDLITIVIPPALPAALTVGKLCAQTRLASARIFCVNSRVINVAGSLDCVCFDKTGTLTEDGMDLRFVVPVEDKSLRLPLKEPSKLPQRHPLLVALATCHSLTRIDGQISGDPLDVKMFESSGWLFEEPQVPDTAKFDLLVPAIVRPPTETSVEDITLGEVSEMPYEVGIVQQQQFSSTLQRMSVVTRTLGQSDLVLYCKGSPEVIVTLSKPETVPPNLMEELAELTASGFRVLALGSRVLPAMNVARLSKTSRAELETDLDFLGLLVMENRLKSETTPIISELRAAHIKVAMITGDNIQTAVSVARECGIVSTTESVVNVTIVPKDKDAAPELRYTLAELRVGAGTTTKVSPLPANGDVEVGRGDDGEEYADGGGNYRLAITGSTWAAVREHYPELIPRIASRGAVFARMTSDQKQQLVLELQSLGYYVAMCGDGANDCGALRAAHVGISLSEAEASVAAPFTARDPHIGCVPRVIREGRAALCTSIGIFKFMVLYSLTEFTSAIVLYGMDSNLTDLQFLFIDVCLVMNFAFFFSKTDSFAGPIYPRPPQTSLLSLNPLTSMGLQIALNVILQAIPYHLVRQFSFYEPFNPTSTADYACFENYSVYCVSMFQYIVMAIVYSQGAPYRKSLWSNRQFSVSLSLMTAICIYITVGDTKWINSTLELIVPPLVDYRVLMVLIALVGFVLALILEKVVVENIMAKRLRYWRHNVYKSKRKYLAIERDLRLSRPHWPPIETGKTPIILSSPNSEQAAEQYDNPCFVDSEVVTKF